jgi:hypothetical protein
LRRTASDLTLVHNNAKDAAMHLISRARRLGLAILAAAAVAGPAAAQAPSYDGDWAGTLEAQGQKFRLELHMKTTANGVAAVLDSLDQDRSVPADAVRIDSDGLSLGFVSTVVGEFKGKLSANGKTLVGTWTQGETLPLTLTRKAATTP